MPRKRDSREADGDTKRRERAASDSVDCRKHTNALHTGLAPTADVPLCLHKSALSSKVIAGPMRRQFERAAPYVTGKGMKEKAGGKMRTKWRPESGPSFARGGNNSNWNDKPKHGLTEGPPIGSHKLHSQGYIHRYKVLEQPRHLPFRRHYYGRPSSSRIWTEQFFENSMTKKVIRGDCDKNGNLNNHHNEWKMPEAQRNRHSCDPVYTREWEAFWQRRYTELKSEGKNPVDHNYEAEWMVFWHKRRKELEKEKLEERKLEERKLESKRQYGLTGNHGPHQGSSPIEKERVKSNGRSSCETKTMAQNETDSLDTRRLVKNPSPPQPKRIVLPSEEFRQPKSISVLTSNSSPSTLTRQSSNLDLLQVLRTLATLEDCLGSLGPSITLLLSRALSTERYDPGSSSKLLRDDSSCVDLLETSKEKLKGLLSAGIVNGAKATAAKLAVEKVAAILSLIPHPNHLDDPADSLDNLPPTLSNTQHLFDMATLMANLQVVGLLLRTQSSGCSQTLLHPGSAGAGKPHKFDETSHFQTCVGTRSHTCADRAVYRSCLQKFQNSDQIEQFSAEELKILIFNFRTLTSSQQCDLIDYLRHLEEKYSKKNMVNYSEPIVSTASLSPLSKKYRQFETVINPSAPDPPKLRCPTVLKMTGLSSDDLESYGIPLDELDVPLQNKGIYRGCPTLEEDLRRIVSSKVPQSSINHLLHTTSYQIPHQQEFWSAHFLTAYQSGMNNEEKQPIYSFPAARCNNGLAHNVNLRGCNIKTELIDPDNLPNSNPNEYNRCLNRDELQRLSFCHNHLDPRQNRINQQKSASKFQNVFLDLKLRLNKETQEPILIPTSPIQCSE